MIKFGKNHTRGYTMWLDNPKNKEEIEAWTKHIHNLYPESKTNPDWLIEKYRKKYGRDY